MRRFKRSVFDRLLFYCLPSSRMRIKYLKKHEVLAGIGKHCFYQSREIPVEPYLVKLHDNVVIAANVHIVPHDIIHLVFNHMDATKSFGHGRKQLRYELWHLK